MPTKKPDDDQQNQGRYSMPDNMDSDQQAHNKAIEDMSDEEWAAYKKRVLSTLPKRKPKAAP